MHVSFLQVWSAMPKLLFFASLITFILVHVLGMFLVKFWWSEIFVYFWEDFRVRRLFSLLVEGQDKLAVE